MYKLIKSSKIKEMEAKIFELEDLLKNKENIMEEIPPSIQERLADLEVRMSKLWSILLETSRSTGKEKLTKYGKLFGGQAQSRL